MSDLSHTVDFPVLGLDATWTGPRWLDHHEGPLGGPAHGVWLGHGQSIRPQPGAPWVDVGTFPRERDRGWDPTGVDLDRLVAQRAAFMLLDLTAPRGDQVPGSMGGVLADRAEREADRWTDWPSTGWSVDGRPVSARVLTWAGAWVGLTLDVDGLDVMVLGAGLDPSDVRLADVGDGAAHHVDLTRPLDWHGSVERSVRLGLGVDHADLPDPVWPWHPDHDRLAED